MSDEKPITVHEAMRRVMEAIGVIGKDSEMKGDGPKYSYRGIDDIMPRTTPLLAEHGVIVTPRIASHAVKEHFNGREYHHLTEVEFTFTGPDGSTIVTSTLGEALDGRDKGANKAMTAALKYALVIAFQIASKGSMDDPDHSSQEPPAPPPTPDELWVTEFGASMHALDEEKRGEVKRRIVEDGIAEGLTVKQLKAMDEPTRDEVRALVESVKGAS